MAIGQQKAINFRICTEPKRCVLLSVFLIQIGPATESWTNFLHYGYNFLKLLFHFFQPSLISL